MPASQIERDILEKMYAHRFIGEKHTSADNVPEFSKTHARRREEGVEEPDSAGICSSENHELRLGSVA
jgi:hypothetical protein